MENKEKTNQTTERPEENPLLSVQTADPATQNRNFEFEDKKAQKVIDSLQIIYLH